MYAIDIITTGFALFAMLFGAGNLIFPPILGYDLGQNWWIGAFAFIITGVGIPLMGIIASANAGKDLNSFGEKVSPLFSKIYGIALILSIGPLLALPRTGATAYEVTFFHIGGGSLTYKYLYLIIYFLVAFLFSVKSNKVVDRIGKILTPILLIVIAILLVIGIFFTGNVPAEKFYDLAFKKGFTEGYQTMDGLAAIVFSVIILNSIKNGRNISEKQERSFLLRVSLIAAFGLAIVYAGLSYVGSTFAGIELTKGVERTDLLVKIAINLLGNTGYMVLAVCVAGACLTTSIGLIVTVSEYFSSILNIAYKKMVIIVTFIGFLFAAFGVNKIIIISVPILVFIYPMSMALIFLHFFKIKNKNIFRGVVFVTAIIGLYDAAIVMGIQLPTVITEIYKALPFENLGLSWLIPSIVIGILCNFKKNK